MYKMASRLVIVMLTFTSVTFANTADFDAGIREAKAFAPQAMRVAQAEIKNYDPKKIFDHYEEHPEQAKYYEGVTQGNTDTMQVQTTKVVSSSDDAKTILTSINSHPQFIENSQSPDMQRALLIQSEADNIVRGVISQYIDCKPKQQCEMSYLTRMCIQSALAKTLSCRKNLVVSAIQPQSSDVSITAHLQVASKRFVGTESTTIDLANESVVGSTGKILLLSLNHKINMNACPGLKLTLVGIQNNNVKVPVRVDIIGQPDCSNHLQVQVKSKKSILQSAPVDFTITYRYPQAAEAVIHESWSNSCNYLEQLGSEGVCQIKDNKCLSPNVTKVINGVAITRPCWEKQVSYECNSTVSPTNECNATQEAGCVQTNSVCEKKVGNVCLSYQQTYQCPQKNCVNTANIICGDGKDYCLNGDCTDHSYHQSEDFSKALTTLSATKEAAKNFDTQLIFKGYSRECRDDAGNFSNCCKGSGWGQDVNLAHCDDDEKTLGSSREKKLAIYVGRYCSSQILGHCIEHKETYCVFSSKVAKVIQEQGRAQLRLNFGDGKHSNCRGITPTELSRIDFSKIDFGQEIIDELGKQIKNPDLEKARAKIQQHITQFEQSGQSNE